MPEYAVLDQQGEVVSIVMTTEPVKELYAKLLDVETGDFSGQIRPVDEVSIEVLRRYRYWTERP